MSNTSSLPQKTFLGCCAVNRRAANRYEDCSVAEEGSDAGSEASSSTSAVDAAAAAEAERWRTFHPERDKVLAVLKEAIRDK